MARPFERLSFPPSAKIGTCKCCLQQNEPLSAYGLCAPCLFIGENGRKEVMAEPVWGRKREIVGQILNEIHKGMIKQWQKEREMRSIRTRKRMLRENISIAYRSAVSDIEIELFMELSYLAKVHSQRPIKHKKPARAARKKDQKYCAQCGIRISRSSGAFCSERCRLESIKNAKCYFAEARAMLEGRHWEGKNRCVKLRGDE